MHTVMPVTLMINHNARRIPARMVLDTVAATRPSRLVGSTCSSPRRVVAIPVETLVPILLAGILALPSPSHNRTPAFPRAASRVCPTSRASRNHGSTALRDPWLQGTGKLPSSPPVVV